MLNVSNQINVLLTCLNNFNFKTIHFSFSYFYLFIIYPEYLNIWKLAIISQNIKIIIVYFIAV